MSNEIEIIFIYADQCDDCKLMEEFLKFVTKHIDKPSRIKRLNCESDEALDFALDNDIDDIPACVIGDKKFVGKDSIDQDAMMKALREA